MARLLPDSLLIRDRDYFRSGSDFDAFVSGDEFTTVASDSGTATVGDAAGGILTLAASDGTVADNDETYLKGTKEIFKFAASKPFRWEALVKFTEANTDDANVIAGVKDAVAADALADNGGGPPASYSGALFYKVDGGTTWQCESSVGGTQITTDSEITAGGSAYQRLRIEFQPLSSTSGEVRFWIDGVFITKHSIDFSSATEMQHCLGVKNGAGNAETLLIDYVEGEQLR